jgi:hypothetical protein
VTLLEDWRRASGSDHVQDYFKVLFALLMKHLQGLLRPRPVQKMRGKAVCTRHVPQYI